MVPVVSLLALWAYATVTTAQDVSRLRQVQRVDADGPSPCRGRGRRPPGRTRGRGTPRHRPVRRTDRRTGRARTAHRPRRSEAAARRRQHRRRRRGAARRSRPPPGDVRHRRRATAPAADRRAGPARGLGRRPTAATPGPSRRPSAWAVPSPASRTPTSAPTRACCSNSPARARRWPRRTRCWRAPAWPAASTGERLQALHRRRRTAPHPHRVGRRRPARHRTRRLERPRRRQRLRRPGRRRGRDPGRRAGRQGDRRGGRDHLEHRARARAGRHAHDRQDDAAAASRSGPTRSPAVCSPRPAPPSSSASPPSPPRSSSPYASAVASWSNW